MNCPTVTVPRTGNAEDHPWQIHNDLIVNAAVWRNGGSGDDTYLCDECIRIGLRAIKLEVDKLLGLIEAGRDKDAELATLNERLGLLQFYHDSVVYAHNRMQERLGAVLKILAGYGVTQGEAIKHAQWEVARGPEKVKTNEKALPTPSRSEGLQTETEVPV